MPRSGPEAALWASPWWLVVAGTAIVILLAAAVGADLTDAFDRVVIGVVRGDVLATAASTTRPTSWAGWTAGAVIVLLYARVTRRVSPEPAAAMVDAGPAAPRSDRPAPH